MKCTVHCTQCTVLLFQCTVHSQCTEHNTQGIVHSDIVPMHSLLLTFLPFHPIAGSRFVLKTAGKALTFKTIRIAKVSVPCWHHQNHLLFSSPYILYIIVCNYKSVHLQIIMTMVTMTTTTMTMAMTSTLTTKMKKILWASVSNQGAD